MNLLHNNENEPILFRMIVGNFYISPFQAYIYDIFTNSVHHFISKKKKYEIYHIFLFGEKLLNEIPVSRANRL